MLPKPNAARLLAVCCLAAASLPAPQTAPLIPRGGDSAVIRLHHGTGLRFDITPDGRTLIFDLLGQLWSLPVEGGTATALTNAVRDTSYDSDPAVSPDGKWVAFRSDRPRGSGIWLYSLTQGSFRQLTDSALHVNLEHRAPAWSSDGTKLAYTRAWRLWLHELSSGADRPVTPEGLPEGFGAQPSWTRAGRIVVTARTLMEIDLAANRARRVDTTLSNLRAPRYSPDERRLAYFRVRDSSGLVELWVWNRGDSAGRLLAAGAELSPLLLRWAPDGSAIYYSAAGGLFRVSPDVGGGPPREIPFEASLTLSRPRYGQPSVSFPGPGSLLRARGFGGLALAPDGARYALIALGKLWIAQPGQPPQPIAELPVTARGLSWSPDGSQVVWSAGAGGAEDLFITEIGRRVTRRLTALPGRESQPAWSPDSRSIAFLHWAKPALRTPPWDPDTIGPRIRVILAAGTATRLADTRDLGAYAHDPFGMDRLSWNAQSSAILSFRSPGWPVANRDSAQAVWIGLDGSRTAISIFPYRPSFVHVDRDGALTYIQDGQLWRSTSQGTAKLLSESPALFPSVANDGTVLFASGDGLRLRRPQGEERRLGWPVAFRTPEAPAPLLVRNARIFDGSGAPPVAGRDILIVNGRISRIAQAGRVRPRAGVRELDAGGRLVMPGLIDAHSHVSEPLVPLAALYYGVTTLRDMGSSIAAGAMLRDAQLAGVTPGARVVLSGFRFYPSPTSGGLTADMEWMPRDSASMQRGLALLQSFGGGHVKMRFPLSFASGAMLVRLARARGLSISGHCANPLPLVLAGISGQDHLDGQCDDRAAGMGYEDRFELYRALGMWGVPTIFLHEAHVQVGRDSSVAHQREVEPFLSPILRLQMLSDAPSGRLAYFRTLQGQEARKGTERFHRAGLPLALGTDEIGFPDGVHRELEELVRAGLSPAEALAAATLGSARALGVAGQVGLVAPGKLADLLILDGDPLTDIGNTRRIFRVIQGGQEISRAALLERARGQQEH